MNSLYFNAPWKPSLEADDDFNFDDTGLDTGDDTGDLDAVTDDVDSPDVAGDGDATPAKAPRKRGPHNKPVEGALKKAGEKKKTAESGYVDQPTIAVYLQDKPNVESLFGCIAFEGAMVSYRPWRLGTVSQEGIQVMINGVVQKIEEEQRKKYVEEQRRLRYTDYNLFVVGRDTDPHLYEELEPDDAAPELVAAVLADPEGDYDEGFVESLEARFGRVYRSMSEAQGEIIRVLGL